MRFTWQAFIKDRLDKTTFTGLPLTIFTIVFLVFLGTFIGITDSIVNSAPIVKIDASFAHYLYMHRTQSLIDFFYVLTNLGGQIAVILFLAVSVIYLFYKKELAYLYSLIVAFVGMEGSVFVMKLLINRDRPGMDLAFYLETSKSFPSGHSAVAMAFFGFVTYYFLHHVSGKNKQVLVATTGTLLIALIGFSRLYLVVHYLSDVLGGYLLGGLWLAVGIILRERHFYTNAIKKGKTE